MLNNKAVLTGLRPYLFYTGKAVRAVSLAWHTYKLYYPQGQSCLLFIGVLAHLPVFPASV